VGVKLAAFLDIGFRQEDTKTLKEAAMFFFAILCRTANILSFLGRLFAS